MKYSLLAQSGGKLKHINSILSLVTSNFVYTPKLENAGLFYYGPADCLTAAYKHLQSNSLSKSPTPTPSPSYPK
jgi:hypothetical protein